MAVNQKPTPNAEGHAPAPMLSTPLRPPAKPASGRAPLRNLYSGMASSMPLLKKELDMAEMTATPAQFVESCFMRAVPLAILLEVLTLAAMSQLSVDSMLALVIAALGLPLFFFLGLQYFLMQPRVIAKRRGRKIDQELVFAGRHLLIELRSGVMLYDAMLGITRDYGEVSREFNKIVEKVTLGVPMAAALHDVAEHCPSAYGRRVILQMANSLSSGSDVADSLEMVLEQVSQEQIIQLKAYGQKLNPLVMFYMMFGIIIPSLGVAFLVILLSFMGGSSLASMGSGLLIVIFAMVSLIQLMFLSVVENSRPSFDL